MFFLHHEVVTGNGPWPLISRTLSSTQLSLHFFPLPAETTTGRSEFYPSGSLSTGVHEVFGCSSCVSSLRAWSFFHTSQSLRHFLPHQMCNHTLLWSKQRIDCIKPQNQGGKKLLEVTKELLTWAPPAWSTKKTKPHRERCCFEPTEQLKTSPFSITMF